MTHLTLEIQDPELAAALKALLGQMEQVKIIESSSEIAAVEPTPLQTIPQHLSLYWLERLAHEGGIGAISDPVEWQREARTDRVLPNREV